LKITFQGKQNIDFHEVSEKTTLPAGKWNLRAMIRTDNLTTDQGVRLGVSGKNLDAITEALNGTHGWTAVQQNFELKEPSIVRVAVVRQASRRFDNKISGTAWIDSVELSLVH
jgi:hypothetical protein